MVSIYHRTHTLATHLFDMPWHLALSSVNKTWRQARLFCLPQCDTSYQLDEISFPSPSVLLLTELSIEYLRYLSLYTLPRWYPRKSSTFLTNIYSQYHTILFIPLKSTLVVLQQNFKDTNISHRCAYILTHRDTQVMTTCGTSQNLIRHKNGCNAYLHLMLFIT